MNPEQVVKYRFLTRIANHQTMSFIRRAIPYGSYTETAAANALMLIGLGALAMALFSTLIEFKII